jgi:hypothetical protein
MRFSPEPPFSPFADPAIGAAFANVTVAGLAAESFIRAVQNKVKRFVSKFGHVIEVTPQSYDKSPGVRGTRVDVLVKTDANELIIFEVQVIFDRDLQFRNLLAVSHKTSNSVQAGVSAGNAPRIVVINLLCYDLREELVDYVQPTMAVYMLHPEIIAEESHVTINIQLPRFLDSEPDFTEALDCWLYTWYEAHRLGKTPQETNYNVSSGKYE